MIVTQLLSQESRITNILLLFLPRYLNTSSVLCDMSPEVRMCESFYNEQTNSESALIKFRMSFRFPPSNTECVCRLLSSGRNYIFDSQ